MKKIICSLAIVMCLTLSIFGFAACADNYTVDTSNIVGIWEPAEGGGVTNITRIEFKKPAAGYENQGEMTFYENHSTVPNAATGTWAKIGDNYNIYFGGAAGYPSTLCAANLSGGKLHIQFIEGSDTTIAFRKVRD